MQTSNPILISIFHDRSLYEFRLRGSTITSITYYSADNNRVDYPAWEELSDEVQYKCLVEVRRHINGD